jgi:hypothetical protein
MMGLLSSVFRGGSPVTGDEALAARCAEHVAGNARLSPAAQVDIYRRQFWSRHIDALREDYAGLEFLLGEERFEAFCRAYLEAHPPASFTLRDLGCDLARFARSFGGFPEGRAEIARDMARYESALVEIFDGTEPPPLDPAKVQGVPEEAWSTARIALHPLLVRMPLGYPVHLLRADLKFGRTPSADVGRDSASAGPSADVGRDSASAGPSIPSPRPVHLAVFRKDLIVRYEELDPAADALLDALGRGVPLVPACDAIAAGLDEAAGAALAARVGEWFAQWTSWGLIVDIER